MAKEREAQAVERLIARIRDANAKVRTKAWFAAGQIGAPAVKLLAALMADKGLEVARAAKNGLWQVVRHAGRPGAEAEKKAVVAELVALLGDAQPAAVHREVVWMLSEIGGDGAVAPIAALLGDKEVREDARMALERAPGSSSLAALRAALASAPDDFKLNIAQSLRQRGVQVAGLPCQKLAPTRRTAVKPVS